MDIKSGAKFKGIWEIEVKDKKGNLISKSRCENVITDEELNHILNVEFHGATQITTWYCLMFESDTTPDGDTTYATPVFTETTAYTEGTRPEYEEAESTEESTTNSANKATFTMNATKTLYGAALVGGGTDANTKGNTDGGGTMACAGKFDTAQPVISGNVVNLTYTITSADAG
jgi:hypothetical protein